MTHSGESVKSGARSLPAEAEALEESAVKRLAHRLDDNPKMAPNLVLRARMKALCKGVKDTDGLNAEQAEKVATELRRWARELEHIRTRFHASMGHSPGLASNAPRRDEGMS
jgi:hypothetical protein